MRWSPRGGALARTSTSIGEYDDAILGCLFLAFFLFQFSLFWFPSCLLLASCTERTGVEFVIAFYELGSIVMGVFFLFLFFLSRLLFKRLLAYLTCFLMS